MAKIKDLYFPLVPFRTRKTNSEKINVSPVVSRLAARQQNLQEVENLPLLTTPATLRRKNLKTERYFYG